MSSATQLDSGASPVGSAFTVLNYSTALGGLHIAWGTRDASMDSLQFAFSTGFTGYGIGAANFPAGSYGQVVDEAFSPVVSSFTRTLPGAGIFAGVAAKGVGINSFTDSTGDFSSTHITTSAQSIRPWAMEAPTASETATHQSFSGTGFNRFVVLGHVDTRNPWTVGRVHFGTRGAWS
jgi:hypothetical protein